LRYLETAAAAIVIRSLRFLKEHDLLLVQKVSRCLLCGLSSQFPFTRQKPEVKRNLNVAVGKEIIKNLIRHSAKADTVPFKT
jgi:hypothetical protein